MSESKNPDKEKESRQPYVSAWIAGALTLAQLITMFFLEVDVGDSVLRILGWILWLISIIFGILPIIIFRVKGSQSQVVETKWGGFCNQK